MGQMQVLLSIKPEFANKIFDGSKKFEFRKAIFKNKDIKKIVVYASAPVSKVIGEFEIEEIIKDEINTLWETTEKWSGIHKEFYDDYFSNRDYGYAIKVKNIKLYKQQYDVFERFGLKAPQSFAYIS